MNVATDIAAIRAEVERPYPRMYGVGSVGSRTHTRGEVPNVTQSLSLQDLNNQNAARANTNANHATNFYS